MMSLFGQVCEDVVCGEGSSAEYDVDPRRGGGCVQKLFLFPSRGSANGDPQDSQGTAIPPNSFTADRETRKSCRDSWLCTLLFKTSYDRAHFC